MIENYTIANISDLLEACGYSAAPFYIRLKKTMKPVREIDVYYHVIKSLEEITATLLLQDTADYIAQVEVNQQSLIAERRVAFFFEEAPFGKFAIIACFSDLNFARAANLGGDPPPEKCQFLYKHVTFHSVIPSSGKERVQAWHTRLSLASPYFQQSSKLEYRILSPISSVLFVDGIMQLLTDSKTNLAEEEIFSRQRYGCILALTNWFAKLKRESAIVYQETVDIIQILARYELLMQQRKLLLQTPLDHTLFTQDKKLQEAIFAAPLGDLDEIIKHLSLGTILQTLRFRHTVTILIRELTAIKISKQQEIEAWQTEQRALVPQQSWPAWFYERGGAAAYYVWQHTFAGVMSTLLSSIYQRLSWPSDSSNKFLQPFVGLAHFLNSLIPERLQQRFISFQHLLSPNFFDALAALMGLAVGAGYMYYLGLFENLFSFGLLFLMDGMHSLLAYKWIDISDARMRSLKDSTLGSYRPSISSLLSVTSVLILGIFCWQQQGSSYLRRGAVGIASAEFFTLLFRCYARNNTKLTEQEKTYYEQIFKVFGLAIGDLGLQIVTHHSSQSKVLDEFAAIVKANDPSITYVQKNSWWSFDFFNINAPLQIQWGNTKQAFTMECVFDIWTPVDVICTNMTTAPAMVRFFPN